MDISGLIGALIVLVLIGVGIAMGLATCAALSALVGVGIVSSAVLVGFWKRRTLAGVQVFLVQCGVLLGAPAGAMVAWSASHLWPMFGDQWRILIAGAIGGACGGLVIAWMASAAGAMIARSIWPWVRGRVTIFQRGEA